MSTTYTPSNQVFHFEEKLTVGDVGMTPIYKSSTRSCSWSNQQPVAVIDRGKTIHVASSVSNKPLLQRRGMVVPGGDVKHAMLLENAKRPVLIVVVEGDTSTLAVVDFASGDMLQTFDVSYSIICLAGVEDEQGVVSSIVACGCDGRIHSYMIDERSIIRRTKKNANHTSSWLHRALSCHASECDPAFLDALPIRLLVSDYSSNPYHFHLLIGYSNGLMHWITVEKPQSTVGRTLPQIPAFKGTSSIAVNAGNNSRTKTSLYGHGDVENDDVDMMAWSTADLRSSTPTSPHGTASDGNDPRSIKRSQSDSELLTCSYEVDPIRVDEMSMAKGRGGAVNLVDKTIGGLSSGNPINSIPLELQKRNLAISDNIIEEGDEEEEEEEEEEDDEETSDVDDDEEDERDSESCDRTRTAESPKTTARSPSCSPSRSSSSQTTRMKKLLFDGAICALESYRLPRKTFGVVVALASGTAAIISHHHDRDCVERPPLAVLPGSYQHGAVLAATAAAVSHSCEYDDVFLGFQDGTILLATCNGTGCTGAGAEYGMELSFTVSWSVQLPCPIISLEYGQLLDTTGGEAIGTVTTATAATTGASSTLNTAMNNSTSNRSTSECTLLVDQLSVVTTRSFHLYSMSKDFITKSRTDFVDQFIGNLSFFI